MAHHALSWMFTAQRNRGEPKVSFLGADVWAARARERMGYMWPPASVEVGRMISRTVRPAGARGFASYAY